MFAFVCILISLFCCIAIIAFVAGTSADKYLEDLDKGDEHE